MWTEHISSRYLPGDIACVILYLSLWHIKPIDTLLFSLSKMASSVLAGKVCIVTGATRGIGKGIALQLAEKGAIVYITGRTLDPPNDKVGGSLKDTAREVETRGGTCIPVQCDHSKDEDVKRLFEKVSREQHGQLDILVNNAYSAVNEIFGGMGTKFWELPGEPPAIWDNVNNVGLRNHYICSIYASKLMVPRKRGLIVNISSAGGLRYLFNVPYGIGKEACDRMAADCGHELRKYNVAFVSLWPGPVSTEKVTTILKEEIEKKVPRESSPKMSPAQTLAMFEKAETTELVGQCIASLAVDPKMMGKSGKICMTFDLAREYGLKDKDGHTPMDMCSVKTALNGAGRTWLAAITPSFLRIPKFLLAQAGNKFY